MPYKAFVKIRFDDFSHTTVECISTHPADEVWQALLAEGWARQRRPVRLLGVGVRFEEEKALLRQLELFQSTP